jgi:hypothetical protein
MCRATTRRDVGERTATDALGFRCARTPRPGVDAARLALEIELTDTWRPRVDDQPVAYDAPAACALERWSTTPLRELQGQPLVPGYAIVAAHDQLVWCPVAQIQAIDPGTFKELCSDEGVVQLGFLTTSIGLSAPELAPGTYLVSYRQKGLPRFLSTADTGKRAGRQPPQGAPLEEQLKIDVRFDHVIFSDLHGSPLRALRASVDFGNARDSRLALAQAEGPRSALLTAAIASRTAQKVFFFELELVAEPGAFEGEWK